MHLQIFDDTLPLIFILILVFVIAGRLLRIRRDRVVRILVLVESAEHSLHLLLVYRLQLLGLQVRMKLIHELFRSVVIWSQTLGVLRVMIHPGSDGIELLVLGRLRRTQHIRETFLVCFD